MDSIDVARERALAWLQRIGRHGDAVAAILVALIVAMIVLPLPTFVIDGAIAVNICMALLLVTLALYLPSASAFSSFPVVLLFATLFRLGIEISTSRSILMRADAGAIVETFGRFVAGENVIVGSIVFIIIAIVQFIVVTKGAERVAEVGARFSLDSMPGRQMAIDADLRAGLARPESVPQLRAELARESRMHGAMDGAMKFVKGDAIAGLLIVMVNLAAGVALGVAQHDMPWADALQHYAVLTIGNGLVAQIPALLIALAAATLITRSDGQGPARADTVGRRIVAEALAAPQAWIAAGCVAALFGTVPGMPWYAFAALAVPMVALGGARLRRERPPRVADAPARATAAAVPDDRELRQIVPIRPIVVAVSPATEQGPRFDDLARAARRARNEIVMRYGLTVPGVELEGDGLLEGDAYRIAIDEVVVATGRFHWDCVCVEAAVLADRPAVQTWPQGYPLVEGASWIERAQWTGGEAGMNAGIEPLAYFSRLFAQLLHRHAARFVGVHEAQLLYGWLQREMPAAAKELAQAVSLPRFAEVLRMLVAERVSLRNVKQIVEALIAWAPQEKDTAVVVEHVRLALQAQICQEFSHDGILHAFVLEREVEAKMRASLQQTARGCRLALDHETAAAILDQLRCLVNRHVAGAIWPVILTTQDLRGPLRAWVQNELFDLYVLSYAELTPTQRVRSLGTVALEGG